MLCLKYLNRQGKECKKQEASYRIHSYQALLSNNMYINLCFIVDDDETVTVFSILYTNNSEIYYLSNFSDRNSQYTRANLLETYIRIQNNHLIPNPIKQSYIQYIEDYIHEEQDKEIKT